MSAHSVGTQIQVILNSMFPLGNKLMKLLWYQNKGSHNQGIFLFLKNFIQYILIILFFLPKSSHILPTFVSLNLHIFSFFLENYQTKPKKLNKWTKETKQNRNQKYIHNPPKQTKQNNKTQTTTPVTTKALKSIIGPVCTGQLLPSVRPARQCG